MSNEYFARPERSASVLRLVDLSPEQFVVDDVLVTWAKGSKSGWNQPVPLE